MDRLEPLDHPDHAELDVQRAIDREVGLAMSAIDLVASGNATSTMVIGLRLIDSVLAIVGPLASARGVVVEPIWGPDEATSDIVVHRAVLA